MTAPLAEFSLLRRFTLWCGLLASIVLLARAPAQEIANLSVSVWGIDDGLPNSTVTSIAQTPDGYLWIGTFNGLARFDGIRFVTFSPDDTPELSHLRVERLTVDARGTLWINTYDGALVSCRSGVFTREWAGDVTRRARMDFLPMRKPVVAFVSEKGELIRRSLDAPAGSTWQITRSPPAPLSQTDYCEDGEGTLWCLTRHTQIWKLDGTEHVPVADVAALGSRPIKLLTDQKGVLWVGTEADALRWNGHAFESMVPRDQATPYQLRFLYFPRAGGCWVVADGRLRKFVDRQWVDEVVAWRGHLGDPFVFTQRMHEDHEGGLWFSRARRGLFYRAPDGRAQHLTTATGLPGNFISAWFEDREGNVWLGAERRGLIRLRKTRFQTLAAQGDTAAVPALTITEGADGAMWIGTFGGGLLRRTSEGIECFGLEQNIPQRYAYAVATDRRGRTWVSAQSEDLYLLEEGVYKRPPWYIHGIKTMLVDRNDRLWIGTKDQLCVVQDDKLQRFETLPGVDRPEVRAIVEAPDGAVWVGLGSGHLYRYDGYAFTLHPAFAKLTLAPIYALQPDEDGSMWVGTFGAGLLHVAGDKATRYTKTAGLPDDVIGQVLDDGRGCLWIGSHRGVFRISKEALRDYDSGQAPSISTLMFGRADGLPSAELSTGYQPAAWRAKSGELWFATAAGVAFINPASVALNPSPPQVLVEDVVVDGVSQRARRNPGEVAEIYSGAKHVEIHYTGFSFSSPEQVRFRYRLEGLETQWYEVGGRRFAQYNHLPPGMYHFHVSACNPDGIWSDRAAMLTLRVRPQFWQTWWFIAVLIVSGVGLLSAVVHRVSTARLQRQLAVLERRRAIEQDRARIARDIHDDLGAGLTQISLSAELLRRSPAGEAEIHSRRISETARSLTRALDGIVWAVSSKNDTLESMVGYLSGYAAEFLRNAGLKCRIDAPSTVPAVIVTSEVRNNVLIAVKEVLNNVVKHAGATAVEFTAAWGRDVLTVSIQDDGQGFSTHAPAETAPGRLAPGNGLANLHERMRAIGGTCRVTSGAAGRGTRVQLTVPLSSERNSTSL